MKPSYNDPTIARQVSLLLNASRTLKILSEPISRQVEPNINEIIRALDNIDSLKNSSDAVNKLVIEPLFRNQRRGTAWSIAVTIIVSLFTTGIGYLLCQYENGRENATKVVVNEPRAPISAALPHSAPQQKSQLLQPEEEGPIRGSAPKKIPSPTSRTRPSVEVNPVPKRDSAHVPTTSTPSPLPPEPPPSQTSEDTADQVVVPSSESPVVSDDSGHFTHYFIPPYCTPPKQISVPARKLGIISVILVKVKVLVDENGSIVNAQVPEEETRIIVRNVALEAARRASCRPATLNGIPIVAGTTLPLKLTPDKRFLP